AARRAGRRGSPDGGGGPVPSPVPVPRPRPPPGFAGGGGFGPGGGAAGRRPAPGGAAPASSPGAPRRHWIEINGTRHQISRPTLVLGRSTDADVRIDDPGVSRRHCEIRTGTPSTIQDLGSTNGIVVDGQHTTRATLRDGSRIVVGSTTIIYRQAEG
ncbi:FHA domain-containing protein, partial [Streptomyces sp. NPDC058741]|uniref:FHA domain-containing protein n=1 Tax=Streptomyces sp. NPDC058741 TaxID=3346620 RepID=UPI00368194C0